MFYRSIESIRDAIHQIRVFREHGTTWGEDRESFEENRLSLIEDELLILIDEFYHSDRMENEDSREEW